MRCGVEIPGIGPCEVEGDHPLDAAGWPVHRRGEVTWNGVPVETISNPLQELLATNKEAGGSPLTQAEARAAAVWR